MALRRVLRFVLLGSFLLVGCKSNDNDCATIPTQVTYECEPLDGAVGEDGGYEYGCSSVDIEPDASVRFFASGCQATLPRASGLAGGCGPVGCTCMAGKRGGGHFSCPD